MLNKDEVTCHTVKWNDYYFPSSIIPLQDVGCLHKGTLKISIWVQT